MRIRIHNTGCSSECPPFFLSVSVREIENIRRGPTFGDFGTEASMQDVTVEDYRVQEYRLPSPPPFKCNVLRESLSVDSQNILCATLKRRGSLVISVYLWVRSIDGCFCARWCCLAACVRSSLLPGDQRVCPRSIRLPWT
jgi:hypothetical protein